MTKRITKATKVHATREAWLVAAVESLAPLFAEKAGKKLPKVRVSVGWPGGRGRKNSVIGQCWSSIAAEDKIAQIFISPVVEDAPKVLATLVHELVHAVDDCASGHAGDFVKISKAVGLEGPWKATTAGEELAASLEEIHSRKLGKYPHAALRTMDGVEGPKKQGTRMLKVVCAEVEEDPYLVRMTRKWLDTYGAPSCPCHGEPMIEVPA